MLDIIENNIDNRTVKEEGREVVTNLTRHSVTSEEFRSRIQRILGYSTQAAMQMIENRVPVNGLREKINSDIRQLNEEMRTYDQHADLKIPAQPGAP